MWLVTAMVVACASHALAAGFCTNHTINTNNTWMQFTKEPVPLEYGIQNQFKSIHCCVKGYRSIEWFKDGIPYPWAAGVSNLILYPEAANQTLYVRSATSTDSGTYTCRISNQTHSEGHHINLQIIKRLTSAPKMMYVSEDQWIQEGTHLRLFCEALIGRTYLADARSDLRWRKVWPNGTEGDLLPTQKEINTTRDDVPEIVGSYLMVHRVSPEDYGKYACVVHSNDVVSRTYVTVAPPRPIEKEWQERSVPWRAVALAGASLALLAVTAAALHRRCTPRLRLMARAARARAATPAQRARVLEKDYDVLVCWTMVDRELIRGALLPTLTLKYKYRIHAVEVSTEPDTWYSELASECSRARSLVAVMSPAQHSPGQLLVALRQLRALPVPPVVVLLQNLPDLKREAKDSGEPLVGVLRRTRLIPWRHVRERAFWTQLRLALPMPPTLDPQQTIVSPADLDDAKNSRSGSMTALV